MKRSTVLALLVAAPLAFVAACTEQPTASSNDPLLKPGGTTPAAAPAITYKTVTTIQRNKYRALAVMNADGSNKTNIYVCPTTTANLSINASPSWSPSGNGTATSPWAISFMESSGTSPGTLKLMRRDLYLSNGVPTGTNTATLVTLNTPLGSGGTLGFYGQAWSPSTTNPQIAMLRASTALAADSKYEIHLVPAAGGTLATAYTSPDGYIARGFAWSPDASKMAVYEAVYSTGNIRIAIIDIATGTVSQTLVDGTFYRLDGLDWSRDGNTLAFAANTATNSTFYLYTLSLGSGATPVQRIVGYKPGWSPDGTALVYQHSDGVRKLILSSGTSTALYANNNNADWTTNFGYPDWKR